ncbi:MAG: hypothetical protein NDI94_02605 [Candidatus Woesearchaeota archaeon]|nr:hypothetical protein [Candidatus Woesearchaeota archaeon]
MKSSRLHLFLLLVVVFISIVPEIYGGGNGPCTPSVCSPSCSPCCCTNCPGGGGDDDDDEPPPPPPPICGDGKWTASTDKACEYTANPVIYKDNGGYTGTVCQADGNSCRNDCTCCGDSIKQASEKCDLGPNNGEDTNSDGYIGIGECRNACTFCGDTVIQAPEKCDDGNTVDEGNGDANQCRPSCTFCGDSIVQVDKETCDFGSDTNCRNKAFGSDACTFCGDGVFQADYEFCDPDVACPIAGGCTWENYADWKDSGYYPGCRLDCTACGDGILQIAYSESCDDTRDYEDQEHSSFGSTDYADTCPGGCRQPGFITGDYDNACTCIPEVCDLQDNSQDCKHCEQKVADASYFSQLCWSATAESALWQINIDMNEDGTYCNCCKYGETGCCDDPADTSCSSENRIEGEWVCDGGVDEGYFWAYTLANPTLSSALVSSVDSSPSEATGTDKTSELLECTESTQVVAKYVYLTFDNLLDLSDEDAIPDTEELNALQFEIKYRNYNQELVVEWYNYGTDAWEHVCGPFNSWEVKTEKCSLPDELKQMILDKSFEDDDPIIRLVLDDE